MNHIRFFVVAAIVLAVLAGAAAVTVAAPSQRTVNMTAQANKTFDPSEFRADKGEPLKIVYTNGDYFGRHDLVFELDGGRVVRTDVIGFPYDRVLEFDAPAVDGVFWYYSSVGSDRADGLEGKLYVGNAQPTAGPEPTLPPSDIPYDTFLGDLHNPHGLWVTNHAGGTGAAEAALLVGEGGTGGPASGEFQPGSGDGRVVSAPIEKPLPYSVVVDGITNAVDPGGGVVGANHAIAWDLGSSATGTARVTLVAVAGGPGQASPGEAAKVIAVDGDGNRTVLADTLAFERENNPDGADPGSGGIDSNPWRLVPGPEADVVYIVDAGANDILKLDPSTRELSLFAVFDPVAEDQQAVPSGMVWDPGGSGAAFVSLLGGFGPPTGQLHDLRDLNGDGDALDPGETGLLVEGLSLPADIAVDATGESVYIAEMGRSRLAKFIAVMPDALRAGESAPTQGGMVRPVADKLYGISGLAWAPDGELLASVHGWPGRDDGVQLQTDRVVRIPLDVLATPTPTQYRRTPTPTATPTPTDAGPATETPEPAEGTIFLPANLKLGGFG